MACRLVARPPSWHRRNLSPLDCQVHRAMEACGTLNLCAGLPASCPRHGKTRRLSLRRPPPHRLRRRSCLRGGSGEAAPMEPGEPEDVHVALMVDATNGVNELSRNATLWTVRHRWAAGARFTFNCCWYSSMLILRRRGQSCCILLSHEE